jgi:hypothetical protein
MLVHIVLFWLKNDLSKDDLAFFEKEVSSLEKISSVEHLYVGQPAGTTKRPVIDDSYDFCLTVVLKDVAAHDAYQEDSIHLEFIKKCSHMWEKVKIYDAD